MKFHDPKKTIFEKNFVLDELDDGTPYPTSCAKNIARMSVMEYLYCKRHYWGGYYFKSALKESTRAFVEGALCLLSCTVQLLLWPIVIVIGAKRAIKRDQEFCRKWEEERT